MVEAGRNKTVAQNSFVNRNALCELNPPPAQLGDVLAQIYRDRSQDIVLRDYALQHLAAFYEQLEKVAERDPQTKQEPFWTAWPMAPRKG